MVAQSLIIASYVLSFISFFLTFLTWLGVYISLITSMRSAPRTLPLILSNIRQEILSERSLMRYRLKYGDQFHVFPGRQTHRVGNEKSHASLAASTLKYMWREFKDIERQFLLKDQGDTESAKSEIEASGESDDVWVDEKHNGIKSKRPRRPNRRESHIKSRMGVTEAGLSIDRKTYYNTDLWHRVLWWWKTSDIQSISDRIQKLQIRRMERDMWETDELVKRGLQILGDMSGEDIWYNGKGPHDGRGGHRKGGGNGGGGRGGGGGDSDASDAFTGRDDKGGYRRTSGYARGISRDASIRRRPSSALRSGERDVYEKEVIRVRGQDQSNMSQSNRQEQRVPSRRQSRVSRGNAPSVVEYEVLHPPPVRVETESSQSNGGRRSVYSSRNNQERQRSYSRDRSFSRGRR